MTKYEVIEKIMKSTKISEEEKVRTIKTFLLGWLKDDDLSWLWENEKKEVELFKVLCGLGYDEYKIENNKYYSRYVDNTYGSMEWEEIAKGTFESNIPYFEN